MTAESGALTALLVALSIGVAAVALWRVRIGRGRVDPADALIGMAVLVWVSLAATAGLHVALTGSLAGIEDQPVALAMAGTVIGGLAAAGFSWARCDAEQLGLQRLALPWVAAGLLLVPAFLVVGGVWVSLLEWLGVAVHNQELLDMAGEGPDGAAAWAALVYGALGAPVLEEIIFRGLVLAGVARRLGPTGGAVVSGLLFGLLHLSEPAFVVPLVLFGIALGLLRVRSRSLVPSIVAHAGNNSLALVLAIAGLVG